MYQKGRAWIELNLDHLIWNLRQFQTLLPPQCAVMPAVKANAYGHGAALIAGALQEMGIQDFCAASVHEGIELRQAGITGQILILGYTPPDQFPDLSEYSLTQTVVDSSYAELLGGYGKTLRVHVGIDTGMRRLGEKSCNLENIFRIWEFKNLNITGVFSHLCAADGCSRRERIFTMKQIREFRFVIDSLYQRGIHGFKRHIQGSYGVLNYPFLEFDYARLGIGLYGVLSSSCDKILSPIQLKPVLSLKSRIECVRTLSAGESAGYGLAYTAQSAMRIAAVSIGYADGVPRELSNKGFVLVHGHRAPIIGRICMDQLLIDVTTLPSACPGDEVLLIGKSGTEEITAEEVADTAGTISNEILSRLGGRLERMFADSLIPHI